MADCGYYFSHHSHKQRWKWLSETEGTWLWIILVLIPLHNHSKDNTFKWWSSNMAINRCWWRVLVHCLRRKFATNIDTTLSPISPVSTKPLNPPIINPWIQYRLFRENCEKLEYNKHQIKYRGVLNSFTKKLLLPFII